MFARMIAARIHPLIRTVTAIRSWRDPFASVANIKSIRSTSGFWDMAGIYNSCIRGIAVHTLRRRLDMPLAFAVLHSATR
jgi:hypothetical protein